VVTRYGKEGEKPGMKGREIAITFSPIPSSLGPGQWGSYSVPFTSEDLGGYSGNLID
jgi:hypothetical protein